MNRPLNFRQLEAFRAVMLTGSMTGAAGVLHISQPAVTRLIRDLEADLKLALFHRQGPQIAPTAEAQVLYREAERQFAGAERIRDVARALRETQAGYLHVGAMPTLAASCLPEAVALFLARHPNVVVSVHPDSSPHLLEMLHGQLDVAYAVVPGEGRFDQDVFAATPAVCMLPPGHRLATRRTVTVNDLDGEDFIALGLNSVLRLQINAAMLGAGVRPNVRLETVNSSTAAAYVAQGIGLAIVDRFAARVPAAQGVVVRPFRPVITLQFSAVYRPVNGRSTLAVAFTQVLRELIDDAA
ncbi:LysR family transcriptional regulator [Achromobacter sp. GG226]|uniref:LysR family transcriptional regulator n=1 Tax=Verticiella alkaliphila TaxID=2779529 RepID=UPI001C0CB59B|nr:LysR family transcriptional regulator [Verticiella sp. GG226]